MTTPDDPAGRFWELNLYDDGDGDTLAEEDKVTRIDVAPLASWPQPAQTPAAPEVPPPPPARPPELPPAPRRDRLGTGHLVLLGVALFLATFLVGLLRPLAPAPALVRAERAAPP